MASEVIERDLYGGMYHMIHNPNARGSAPRYKVEAFVVGETASATKVKEVTKPKGVTTILGKVLAKDFVGWALDCMEDYLTEKLPVITAEDLKEGKLESTRRRDSGAGTGSEAHALVEHFLKAKVAGQEPAVASGTPEALNAYNAFVKWFETAKPEVIGVEEVIYSEEYGYAGTYDCMLKINGKVYLCDLKTTNSSRQAPQGIYPEYFIQLGAYALAHDEQRQWEHAKTGTTLLPIEGLMVISCKKNGKLDIMTEEEIGLTLNDCKAMFKKVINLYTFLDFVGKKLGGK